MAKQDKGQGSILPLPQQTFVSDGNLHPEEFRIGNSSIGKLLYDDHAHV